MAWSPSPRVADCRDIARKWGKKQVIVLVWDHEELSMATYGETAALCAAARRMGDVAYDAVYRAYSWEM